MSTIYLKIFLIIVLIIRLIYWFFFFIKLLQASKNKPSDNKTTFSIICCIKNGTRFLNNLNYLINQANKDELIIVEDFSSDGTKASLLEMDQSNFTLIIAKTDRPGKKHALAEGIAASQNEQLVLTDIDCEPASNTWASKMAAHLNETIEIVLGYGPYKVYPGVLNKFIRFETLLIAVQYMSYALRAIPYMGVGRNLAYTKAIFEKVNGFSAHDLIASGDDDLFISAVATSENTAICLDPDTFVYSEPAKTTMAYFRQRWRHISTASHYKFLHQFLLALFAFSGVAFYLAIILGVFFKIYLFIVGIYLAFILPSWIMFYGLARKYLERDLIVWYPIFDFVYFVFLTLLSPFLFIKKKLW